MKKTEIMNTLNRGIGKAGFKLKKHAPEILIVTGVIGTVTSAVLACVATTKVNDILAKSKEEVDKIHESVNKEVSEGVVYTEEDSKKALTSVYCKTGFALAKLYAPSVALGALSLTSIVASHNVLHKRNVALAAAYAAVDNSFKQYRNNVVKRFGEEVDRHLKYGIETQEVEETVVDENGKETKVKKTVETINPEYVGNMGSPYAKFFDNGNDGWDPDPEVTLMFLRARQNYANDLLKARGHLFLNEVYDMLDIPRTQAGQVVGWRYNTKNPSGDNYVDFGLYNPYNENARDFLNGREQVILLDFNVDGNIWEDM